MMGWNKEKLVFIASLVIAVATIASTLPAWRSGGVELSLTRPSQATNVPMGPLRIEWFERTASDDERDPFSTVSNWRVAVADPIPDPPLDSLWRRVPLPEPLAGSDRARPPREATPPVAEEDK